jgi:hypothetical protein
LPATSVPYFDRRCGLRFRGIEEFPERLTEFLDRAADMAPRDYILDNLTLEKCSGHYLQILEDAATIPQDREQENLFAGANGPR